MRIKTLLLLIILINISLFAQSNKNVLIINSYHRGFEWSDKVINGIEKTLYNTKTNVNVLYMDSKRIASEKYFNKMKELYKLQLGKSKYNLIVALDTFAYEFMLKNYSELFKEEELYFVGIEQYSQKDVDFYNLTNKVSGVLEKRAIDETIQIINKAIPKLNKLYIINDRSKNGDHTDPYLQTAIENLNKNIEIEYIRSSNLDKLKKKFSMYKKNEAIFFIRFYNNEDGSLNKNSEIASMIDSCKIPVFSTDTLFIGKGSVGGKLVDIEKLGENAGIDILRILNNRLKVSFIKVANSYEYIFDYKKTKEFNINLERLNLKYTLINTPITFFDKYRKFIDIVFIISPFLVLLILGLIHNLVLRIQRSKISQQRIELDKILLNAIDNPIVWQDKDGRIVEYNTKFEEFMKYKTPDNKDLTFCDFMKNYKNRPIIDCLKKFINKSEAENLLTIKTNTQEKFYIINQTNYTENIYNTSGTVTVLTDITKEKEAIKEKSKHQEFIIQQSKLAEIGEVFSSIAHQWKSPLVEIATIAQEKAYNEDSNFDGKNNIYVNDIMVQVKYMTDTINDFQKFIMPSTKKIAFDVHESISEMLEIIRHNLKYNYINVDINVQEGTFMTVLGYKNEFMQTLLNIVNNSKDAIIKQKKIGNIKKGKITINLINIENYLQLEIIDNGGGIPETFIENIFKPYFTTKDKGHGIGLYMAKLIIEDKIGGKIEAKNLKDGAKFTIRLETYDENISS